MSIKFREELGEKFILTMGLDGCLFAYPEAEWEKFVEGLKKLPGSKDARQLQRHFMAGAAEVEVDKLTGEVGQKFFFDSVKTLKKQAIEEKIRILNDRHLAETDTQKRSQIAKEIAMLIIERKKMR